MAAAISAADRNFSLVIQLLHLLRRPTASGSLSRNGEVIRSINGTLCHIASTPREAGVSWLKSSGRYLCSAGGLFNDEERLLGRSRLCEDVNDLVASIAKEEFNGTGGDVSYLFDVERRNYTQDPLRNLGPSD
jgi:hypothetical protein